MRRSLRQRQAARTSLRRKGEDGSSEEESSSDSEAFQTEKAKDDSAHKSNVVRRRRSLRGRQSLNDLHGNEENRSQETTVGSHFLPNGTDVEENVLKGNVVRRRRSLRGRQSLNDLHGNEENRSQETTVGSHFLPNSTDVEENVLKDNVVRRRRSLRARQSLDDLYGNEGNRSQETTVGSHFLLNNTDVDENMFKGLRPGWWRDLQDSHSTNAVHLNPSPILGDTRYDFSENRPQEWYRHLDLTEIPSFRRTSDTMTRSSGMESYPSPDTASSPKLHRRPLRQKIASVINAGDFQDAYDLEDSKHHSSTRSKSLPTSSHNSRSISREHESLSEKNKNTHENNLTETKNSNIAHSSIFSDTEESPVRRKRPLRRDSKFPSDYQELDAVLEGSDIEIQDAVISTTEAQIHSVNVSDNVEDHPVFRHDGLTESGQSSPSSLRNTNLKTGGLRPFAQKRKRKSSLYENLNSALEDDVESPQGDEIHTKSNSVHSSPLSESTNSPVKNSSKPLRKKRSVKLSNSEDFTKTYEDDSELVQVKDRYNTIDGIIPFSDGTDDNQKERRDKSELEGDQVSNKDHDISHNNRSQKSIGSSILLPSTESPVLPNLRPFKKRLRTLRDYQHFEEALEDNEHSVIRRDKSARFGHDELLLKRVASNEGPSNRDQISGTSKDLQSIEEKSPTTSGDVSPIGKMGYNLFARKKSRKSVYGDLELVLEENSESSQTPTVPSKNISVPSSVPSESSGSPSKRISGSPTKTASKIFRKNKSVILLNERDLATAFEDNSSDTIDRNKSKGVSSVDGDDNVASSTNRRVFEKSVHSNIPSDTTGSPVQTNIRPFKKNSKIITDYQHFEEALDISDTRTSDDNKSRKSQGSTGGGPSTSGSSREVVMVVEQGSSYDIQSPVNNIPPTGKMSIKPLMGKEGQTLSIYKGLEMALQEKITTDYQHSDEALNTSDSRTSVRNKSRKSQGSTGGRPSTSGSSREAAMLISYEIQSSVSNASPAGKKVIKPLVGRKSQKSSVYKDLELALQEKSMSTITTDYQHSDEDDISDSRTSGRNKSKKYRGTSAGPSDSGTSREAAMLVEQVSFKEDSYEIQSSVSNTSPAGKKSIKPLMGRKRQKSSIYKDLELAVQEKSASKITTDDNDDSKASHRNKSRKSHGTTDAGSLGTSREAAMFVEQDSFNEDSYEILSSVSNASPAGKKSVKPLLGRKRRKSSIYKDLELALQEKSASMITIDYHNSGDNSDSRVSGRNKPNKSQGTSAGPSISGTSREATMLVEQDSFKEVSYDIQSSVTNASNAGERNIKSLMGKKSQKSSIYKDLELALQEKSASKITTDDNDDSKASHTNKSRTSRRITGAGPSESGATREATMLVEEDSFKEDSYEIQSSVSDASPAGKKSIKPLMRKTSRKSSYKDLELALQEKSAFKITTDDNDDSKASHTNKSRKSRRTTGAGPSESGATREATMLVEEDSFKEDSYEIESSVSDASPAGKKSIKPLMRKKSRKSSYKDLELALQGESSSESGETPRKSSSVHSRFSSESSKSPVRNVSHIFSKNKSVVLSGLSTDFEGVSHSSNAVEGTKSNKEESESFQSNNLENSRNSADLHKNQTAPERSVSSNTPSDTTESPLQTILTPFQKNTKLTSGYHNLNEGLEDSDSSMFDRGKITRSKTSTQLEHHEHTSNIAPEYSVLALSPTEIAGEKALSPTSLSDSSPIGKTRHRPFSRKKIRKSSIYGGLEFVLDEKAEHSHKSEVHRIGTSTGSSLPPETSGSPIKTTSKPFQKNKSVLLLYEADWKAISEDDSSSSDIVDNNRSKNVRSVDGNDIESSRDTLYNMQLGNSVVSLQTVDMPVKNSQQNVVSSMNHTLFDKYVPSDIHSDTAGSPDLTNIRVLEKNSKIRTDHKHFEEDLGSSDSSLSGRKISRKSRSITVETGGTISTEPMYIEEPVTGMLQEAAMLVVQDSLTRQKEVSYDIQSSPARKMSTEPLMQRKRSVTFKGIDGQEDILRTSNIQELLTASRHKEGADEIQSSPSSLNRNSPVGKMTRQPFTQKVRKSSVYKSLESVLEQNTLPSQTDEILKEATAVPSGLPLEFSGSATKTVSKISKKNKSVILSNEGDLAGDFEDGSYADSDDIEPSQKGQLSGNNKNVFSKQSEQINANNSRHSGTSSMNHSVSDSLVQSDIPSNTGSPITDNQHFEGILDSDSDSSMFARNKSRKSDQVQQESVRQKEMLNIQPSVSNATPARNIPLMQNNSQKSSVSKSLKFAVEENPSVSQTSKLHRKSTSAQSNLSAQYSESPGKTFAKPFHNNKSVVISNEADFAAALDEDLDSSDTTVEKTSVHDIEPSQDEQHSSHLRIMDENSLSLNQDNTDIQHGHEVSVSSDDTVKLSDENSQPHRKNVEGSHSERENTNENTSKSKMPSRSQVLAKPSELEMSFSSNSEPVPVANSTAVVHSPAKKMKYTSDAGGRSSLVERSSHIPSPKQRSFLQNNETSETFPSMRIDKSRRQSGTNMKSPRAVNVQQQLPQDSSARKIGNNTDLHHSSGLVATENDHGNKDIVGNNSFNKSKDQFEPSPVVTTNIKKSISRFRLSNEKRNEAGIPPVKRTSGSFLSKSVMFSERTNNTDKDNLLSLPAKPHTNNVSGLSRSLQKNQDLEKAKERNQERMTEIEENLRKEQKKPRTIQEYFEAMKIANNQKTMKPPRSKPKKHVILVNGKVYHPPPFKKPKAWVSKPLINTILKHCEKKYGPMRKRRKAEEFMSTLCEHVSIAMRRHKNYSTSVENTKKVLYEFGLIKNLHDFYCFVEDNLPTEFRRKAIPCIRAFGQWTGPPWIPGTNIFQELEFD